MNRETDRRTFLQAGTAWASMSFLDVHRLIAAEGVPQSVAELWADFDPRNDKLEIEVVREWREQGGILRYVRFLVGTFKGKPARMAAIYGFPGNAKEKLPAVMHIHGGGQRAFLHEVKLLVGRGYAALSVNWGGSAGGKAPFNAPETAKLDDPNTDWGAVDPSQLNVPGYHTILPGPKQFFEDREHPKNNNWYLLALGCRRGLTFLEQQPEVDPKRLGVHGYSMGGNLTMYVAGSDDRVKAAVPGVGGAGWRWQEHKFTEGTAPPPMRIQGDVKLFARTLSFESYAPLIRCPVLHRSSTNDFHGWMDDVYRTNALIEKQPTRYCWSPHLNHRLTPDVAVAMPLWFDHYLKGGPALPETPRSELLLQTADRIPLLRVTPDAKTMPVNRVAIYYGVDADPRARFWRSAEVTRDGDAYVAKLPLHSLDLPLFAFANVYYRLPNPVSLATIPGNPKPVEEVCISSLLHSRSVEEVKKADLQISAKPTKLIDDFNRGWRDWYVNGEGHLALQQWWTRKITDPLYRGSDGAKLALTLKMAQQNQLSVVLLQNEWRNYRGPRLMFVSKRVIRGSDKEQVLIFEAKDFESKDGPLKSWAQIDQLGICAYVGERGTPEKTPPTWNGPAPVFVNLAWV